MNSSSQAGLLTLAQRAACPAPSRSHNPLLHGDGTPGNGPEDKASCSKAQTVIDHVVLVHVCKLKFPSIAETDRPRTQRPQASCSSLRSSSSSKGLRPSSSLFFRSVSGCAAQYSKNSMPSGSQSLPQARRSKSPPPRGDMRFSALSFSMVIWFANVLLRSFSALFSPSCFRLTL